MQSWLCALEFRVNPTKCHQFTVGSLLAHLAMLNHANQVSVLDCRQPMGNHQASTTRSGCIQSRLDQLQNETVINIFLV